MSKYSILIFGSSGQLSSGLIDIQNKWSNVFALTCVGRPEGDITDKNKIDSLIEQHSPSVVINAAAYTSVDQAELASLASRVKDYGIKAVREGRSIVLGSISMRTMKMSCFALLIEYWMVLKIISF